MRRYLIMGVALLAASPLAAHALSASASVPPPTITACKTSITVVCKPGFPSFSPVQITTQPTVPSR